MDPVQRADYDAVLRNSFPFDTSSSNASSSISSTVETQAAGQPQQSRSPSLSSSPTPPSSELLTTQRNRLLFSPSPVPMAPQSKYWIYCLEAFYTNDAISSSIKH